MPIPSLQLEAFVAVAQEKNFSRAARRLFVTQSALSQRILNLEGELEATLFVRDSSGPRLTENGESLLKYCLAKDSLEQEFLVSVGRSARGELAGRLRLASFSSHARSVLLPKIGDFCRRHPDVQVEMMSRELGELPGLLKSGQADFIFSTQKIDQHDVENILVGSEENVLVQAKNYRDNNPAYIDHDEQDRTTQEFFKEQKNSPRAYKRIYFDEIYAILDAVEEGLGRAIVPRHLIERRSKLRVVPGFKSLVFPVYMIHYRQSFYTRLQKAALKLFSEK